MKKIILGLISVMSVVFLTTTVKADGHEGITLSGYMQFFAGSADQTKYNGLTSNQGLDKSGISDGHYSRIIANAGTTLDNGINVAVTYTMAKDCRATSVANCNISVNQNDMAFTGGFGSVNVGNTPGAGTMLHSRLTAAVPTGEPDGGVLGDYYLGDVANTYGQANEVGYASNATNIRFMSNTYEGFTVGLSHTPNMGEGFTGDGDNGQDNAYAAGTYNDRNEIVVKYATDFDGFGFAATVGYTTANAGSKAGVMYNDLNQQTYSLKGTYGGFSADWRMNNGSDSGRVTSDGSGGNEGSSVCGMYVTGAITLGACSVETDFDATITKSNATTTNTINAGYNLGGGVNLGVAFYSVTQTANSVTRTDVDGVITRLDVGF